MSRTALTALVLLALVAPARADRIAPTARPAERALRVSIVVVGKVTAVEKDAVDAPLYPGGPKISHKIAVVKIESNLFGADNTTHLKVGFVPAGAGGRRGPENPDLKEGEEWLFFLTKHHSGEFHAIPYMTPPVGSKAETYKADVESVKKMLGLVADPAKALKAEKAEDRFNAAVAIIYKLRTPPEGALAGTETVALTADESRPILKALAEGMWKSARASDEGLNGYSSFARLGLTEADGWKPPAAKPGVDFFEQTREAYAKWLDGPGKDYRIKKLVPKKGK
jgi:hypothetical protein